MTSPAAREHSLRHESVRREDRRLRIQQVDLSEGEAGLSVRDAELHRYISPNPRYSHSTRGDHDEGVHDEGGHVVSGRDLLPAVSVVAACDVVCVGACRSTGTRRRR